MIYILAGIAKSGKSFIAKEISNRFHMHVIATDWIMMMLHHGNKNLNIDVTKSDRSVSRLLEPYIEGLIKSLSTSKKDVLIEGVHVQPHFAKYLEGKYPDKLSVLFLGYKDIEPSVKAKELLDHAHLIENPWYLDYQDEAFSKLINYLIKESSKLEKSCLAYDQIYYEVQSVKDQMDDIIQKLIK